jgi:LPS-assembly lipoprotein
MWWHRFCAAALLAAAASSLAACNVQPLYGTTDHGSRLGAVMEGVEIAPIPGRVGQKLRNELIFTTTGGGAPGPRTYKLDIVVKENVVKELVKISGDATSEVYELNANFKLTDKSGNVVLQGKAVSRAAYQRFQTIFSNVRAQYDAQDRVARTVADSIRIRIAAYLAQAA